jgi:hypothetical protein
VKLWDKLKAKFQKNSCCDSCNTCGAAPSCGCGGGHIGGVIVAPPAAAPAPAPGAAPMPKPGTGSVMGNGVIVTPVAAPRLSNDQPF